MIRAAEEMKLLMCLMTYYWIVNRWLM